MTLYANVVACLVFAGLRLGGMTNDLFKDLAHVYVGLLLMAGWFRLSTLHVYTRSVEIYFKPALVWKREPWFWRMAWMLTAVEVFAFVAFKYGWMTR